MNGLTVARDESVNVSRQLQPHATESHSLDLSSDLERASFAGTITIFPSFEISRLPIGIPAAFQPFRARVIAEAVKAQGVRAIAGQSSIRWLMTN